MGSTNTQCHLGNGMLSGTSCPQGLGFEVRKLTVNGGEIRCSNQSCPHQVQKTANNTVAVLGNNGPVIVIPNT